jgi:TIR domain
MPSVDPKLRLLVRHSDSPKDLVLVEELLDHLKPLQRFANLDVWSDARLRAGDETRREIERAIDQTDVAMLLLSIDFFASDTLLDVEVPKLMERHRQGSLRVVPVLLRSCLWEAHPWLSELRPLPRDGKSVASHQGDERDRVLTELVKEIAGLVTPSPAAGTSGNQDALAPAKVTPPIESGTTYNITIHSSTIGAFGTGDGVSVTGGANAIPSGPPLEATRSAAVRPTKLTTPAEPMDRLREVATSIGMHTVYLSYDPADEGVVERIYIALGAHGALSFFFAEHAVGGERLGRVARVNINQHDRVVLVCSKRSLSSPKVLNDLEETLEREAREGGSSRLIPLDLDGFVRSGEWRPPNADVVHAVQGRVMVGMIGADRDVGTLATGVAKLLRALKG